MWHGTADTLVVPANAESIVDQWRDRVGLGAADGETDRVDGHQRTIVARRQGPRDGRALSTSPAWAMAPRSTTRGKASCGIAGPHMLDAGICSTSRIAGSWGLTGKIAEASGARAEAAPRPVSIPALKPAAKPRARPAATPRATGVGAVIEDALRAAGLMR